MSRCVCVCACVCLWGGGACLCVCVWGVGVRFADSISMKMKSFVLIERILKRGRGGDGEFSESPEPPLDPPMNFTKNDSNGSGLYF